MTIVVLKATEGRKAHKRDNFVSSSFKDTASKSWQGILQLN